MSYVERSVLSRRVKVSCVLNWVSLDFTTRKRAVAVTALDDPQRSGGPDGCIVCFDHPRIVLFDADRSIVTDPGCNSVVNRLVRVYGEATGRRVSCVEPDEDGFDGCPSLSRIDRVQDRAGVEAMGYTVVIPFYCILRVRTKNAKRIEENLLR